MKTRIMRRAVLTSGGCGLAAAALAFWDDSVSSTGITSASTFSLFSVTVGEERHLAAAARRRARLRRCGRARPAMIVPCTVVEGHRLARFLRSTSLTMWKPKSLSTGGGDLALLELAATSAFAHRLDELARDVPPQVAAVAPSCRGSSD